MRSVRPATAALVLGVLSALHTRPAHGLDNGLGLTPQMGYNSWYDLMCTEHMNEATIRGVADALVKTGLARAGFRYLNLDDCYIKDRLPN